MRSIIFILILWSCNVFAGSPYKSFSGSYQISSAPIHDPQEQLEEDTHLYLSLKGEPAQQMYKLIEGDPQYSECGVDHYLKKSGNLQCSFYPSKKEYSCDFSINIAEGTLDSGGWC